MRIESMSSVVNEASIRIVKVYFDQNKTKDFDMEY